MEMVLRRLGEVENTCCGAGPPMLSPVFLPPSQDFEKSGHTVHRTLIYLLVNDH